ncbi:MAG: AbrB family transcriptional regulator [Gaiellaceae bacterium]
MPGSSEIVTSEPATDADSNILRWLGVALATFAATIAMSAVELPTPALFAALLIGITYALVAVRRPLDIPSKGLTIGQALIGVAIGTALDASTLGAVASNWFAVSAVTLATLALSLGVGIAIARLAGISQATGTLGLIAGGASGIVAMADELGADSRLVAFMQYVRVLVVVLVAPFVATILLAHGERGAPPTEPKGTSLVGDLAFTGACVLAGVLVARRLRVTAGTLLCPLGVAAILSTSGVAGDASVPALVQSVAFALIGLQVGLRFTIATIRGAQALLPWVLAAIFVLVTVSAGLAALLVPLAHVSFADAYLATTPGGLYAVLAASVGIGANTTFVVSVQVLRILVMVIGAPQLVRIVARWDNAQSG